VSFHKYIATVAVNIPVCYPMSARMGWTLIVTWNPDVAAPVPALISADPDKSPFGRRAGALDNHWRRSYANHYLRKRSGRKQSKSEQYC